MYMQMNQGINTPLEGGNNTEAIQSGKAPRSYFGPETGPLVRLKSSGEGVVIR